MELFMIRNYGNSAVSAAVVALSRRHTARNRKAEIFETELMP